MINAGKKLPCRDNFQKKYLNEIMERKKRIKNELIFSNSKAKIDDVLSK